MPSSGSAQTPVSNTGLNCQRQANELEMSSNLFIRVDTVSGVCRNVPNVADAIHIINLLEKTFDDSVQFRPELSTNMGKRWDGHSTASLRGLKFWWQAPQPGQPGQLMMYLGGSVLSAASHTAAHDVFCYLRYAYALECKRIDIALDDHDRIASLDDVRAASVDGNYAYVHRSKIIQEGPRKGVKGETIYFGSPKSDKLLRIYDKTVESNGEIDAIRWEAQYRDEKANMIFYRWLDFQPNDLDAASSSFLASVVTGCVHFCDRTDDEAHIDRCPLLDWWAVFLEHTSQGIRIPCVKKVPLLQRSLDWLQKSVFPTIAMVSAIFKDGFDAWLESCLHEGDSRLSSKHNNIILMSAADGWGLA